MRISVVLIFITALLAGCLSSSPIQTASSFPLEVKSFPEIDKFPDEVSGYRRGKVFALAHSPSAIAVTYDRYDGQLQNAVTLYFGPRAHDAATQVRDEKAAIIEGRPDYRVVSEKVLALEKGGLRYDATYIEFEYMATLSGQSQKVRSILLVAFTPEKRFKVRSTAPAEQGALAASELLRLLDGVSWAP